MIHEVRKAKDDLIKRLQELYGSRIIELKVNPSGSINLVTSKGEFFIPKPGKYT